jgi:hypothetical protein
MQTVKLEITPQVFNVIMAGLEELPHKVSRGAIDDLIKQVQAQQQPQPPEVPPAPTEDKPSATDKPETPPAE